MHTPYATYIPYSHATLSQPQHEYLHLFLDHVLHGVRLHGGRIEEGLGVEVGSSEVEAGEGGHVRRHGGRAVERAGEGHGREGNGGGTGGAALLASLVDYRERDGVKDEYG